MSELKKRSMRHLDVATLSPTMRKLNPHLYHDRDHVVKVVDQLGKVTELRNPAQAVTPKVTGNARRAKEANQTEREYEAMLRRQFPCADIRWEALTLRMASLVTYTPDYIVFLPDGIECHEVKGSFVFPKALVKPRLAAEAFPWKFVLAQKRKGEWEITTLNGIWTRSHA